MHKKLFVTLFFAFTAVFTLSAQSLSSESIFVDEDSQTYFIDFQSLSVNLDDIVVRDNDNNVILEDNVSNLPVDTIYELDLSAYNKGTYHIELRSYTSVIKKAVRIK